MQEVMFCNKQITLIPSTPLKDCYEWALRQEESPRHPGMMMSGVLSLISCT